MNQTDEILAYLQAGKRITPIDALNLYGCFRLASRISDLRKDGHNIQVEMISKNGKSFAEYRLELGVSRAVPASSFKKQAELLEVPRVLDYNDFAV